jgi:S-DNA-T family DNA segregation ATPase FtsK/SpoIIIE
LFAIFCGLLVALSLATFDSRDPWLNHVVSGVTRVHNKAGLFGSYLSGFFYDILGFASWVIPAFLCLAGARRILGAEEWAWWRWTGFVLLTLCISLAGAASDLGDVEVFAKGVLPQGSGNVSTHGGGIIGHMLYVGMVGWLSSTGTFLIWLFSLLLAMQMLTGMSWLSLLATGSRVLWQSFIAKMHTWKEQRAERKQARLALAETDEPARPAYTAQAPLEVATYPLLSAKERFEATDAEPSARETEVLVLAEPDTELPVRETKTLVLAEPDAAPDDAYVHPLVPRPQQLKTEPAPHEKEDAYSLPSLFPAMPAATKELSLLDDSRGKEEEEDLPPWVRDFEQDRVGIQPPQGADSPEDNDIPAYEHKSAAAADSIGELHTEEQDNSFEDEEPAYEAVLPDDASELEHFLEAEAVGYTLRHEREKTFSDALLPVEDNETAYRQSESSEISEDIPPVRSGYDGVVPVFEAPPVEAAQAPGIMATLVERVIKPSRTPLPSLELLQAATSSGGGTPRELLEAKGRSLMTCLGDFSIQGELVGITPGPVVTMFEIRPAPGVRVSRIANLSDDLALALKAVAVRIQAPVPGTDTVGIEIPNEMRETVCLKELLGSQVFQQSNSLLTLALGKDIAGIPAVADLATMPHLLVAGATGAGKSVGINSIILSFLYKARPEEVKLLLLDPKRVEMAIYADLPHLVHPVVTEMQLAKTALEWAVAEMEQRYNAIAKAGVRNITDYNAKVRSWGDNPPSGMEELEVMPYLVIIIDELADLMLVAAKEVETSIVRLAQLARAAGIHLILATQRPSVDVVTGLIKANFPCRISFQVTSKHDSRTILDTVGAEHLLGRGDMLFKPGGGKFQRMHGAFVSDQNVNAVVDYWKSRQRPDYQIDFTDWAPEGSGGIFSNGGGNGGGDIAGDPMYNEAVEFVRQQGKASISLIQRKFRIGFNKAARFVEQMEVDGIIGPADGSKPRMVIR